MNEKCVTRKVCIKAPGNCIHVMIARCWLTIQVRWFDVIREADTLGITPALQQEVGIYSSIDEFVQVTTDIRHIVMNIPGLVCVV